jgi:SAM-dependent methyltransferase
MFSPVKRKIKAILRQTLDRMVVLTAAVPELVTPSSYPSPKPTMSLLKKIELLEQQNRFLLYDNMRVNELLRELIYLNDLKRGYTGSQTKESFDYQWREIPEGEWMPSNPEFLTQATEYLQEFTQIPRDWFIGKNILDAGCGSGRWTYAMNRLGANVTSFDQSAGALGAVKKLVGDAANVKFQQGDLLNLPFEDESFDMVWCFGVPHHTENPLRVLKHLTRCVKPGGYLFVMLYAFPHNLDGFNEQANYEEWRQRLLPKNNREKMEILKNHFPAHQVHGYFDALSPTINDLFTYEWMEAFFRGEGFEDFHRVPTQPNHYVTTRKKS